MSQLTTTRPAELRQAWDQLKKEKPSQRIRECAEELGVSEAELLATTVGEYTTVLQGDWTQLLQRLPTLGRVMSLTRNNSCVLEHKGPFQEVAILGSPMHRMATVVGPIETRVFFSAWKFGFAVRQQTPRGLQQSLQFFDEAGTAITKIFLLEAAANRQASNQDAFDAIVKDFTAPAQTTEVVVKAVREMPTRSLAEVDKAALLADWQAMKDTHDFFGMLRKHQVNRFDAVKLADGLFCYELDKTCLREMLEKAAASQLPIMVFAGNRGNLQIHQGKIQTVRVLDNWLNILDPDFNMHLLEDRIESVWVVKKPTTDGVVTGIEVFDALGELIVQFFGLRKPGLPELDEWRELVAALPRK